jgi:hypothetical protein
LPFSFERSARDTFRTAIEKSDTAGIVKPSGDTREGFDPRATSTYWALAQTAR